MDTTVFKEITDLIKSTFKKEIIIVGDSLINDTHKENCVSLNSVQEVIEIEP